MPSSGPEPTHSWAGSDQDGYCCLKQVAWCVTWLPESTALALWGPGSWVKEVCVYQAEALGRAAGMKPWLGR